MPGCVEYNSTDVSRLTPVPPGGFRFVPCKSLTSADRCSHTSRIQISQPFATVKHVNLSLEFHKITSLE